MTMMMATGDDDDDHDDDDNGNGVTGDGHTFIKKKVNTQTSCWRRTGE